MYTALLSAIFLVTISNYTVYKILLGFVVTLIVMILFLVFRAEMASLPAERHSATTVHLHG